MFSISSPLLLVLMAGRQEAPPGFREMSGSEAAKYDRQGYIVSLVNGKVRIETDTEWRRRVAAEPKPPLRLGRGDLIIPPKIGLEIWRLGDGVRVEDGWLKELDYGEFGGGIFWSSRDRKTLRQVSKVNTALVSRFPEGVFAIGGLAHMIEAPGTGYFGMVVHERGHWRLKWMRSLPYPPRPVAADKDQFVFGLRGALQTIAADGKVLQITRLPSGHYINSIVRDDRRRIWVGWTNGVLSLSRSNGREYKVRWFGPVGGPPSLP